MVNKGSHPEGFWTVPNLICVLRMVGVGPLLWAAYEGHRDIFLWIMIILLLSDWLDGKMAMVLDQRTVIGARLDSGADALMYAATGLSFWWLEEQAIRDHAIWILVVVLTWGISVGLALYRFRNLPSYHMWSAKASWFVVACAVVVLLLAGSTILMPWAFALVVFANLHATAITLMLPRWEADIWSLRQAWRKRQGNR
jgi:phosphatidylglycerophosphate synthase